MIRDIHLYNHKYLNNHSDKNVVQCSETILKKTAMRTLICCNILKLGILLTCFNGFIEHNRSSKQRLIID